MTTQITSDLITPTPVRIESGTKQATTSGDPISFTGLPSWAKVIHISLSGVSLSGTNDFGLRIGDTSGDKETGYAAAATTTSTSGNTQEAYTIAFGLGSSSGDATIYEGSITLTLLDEATNKWCISGVLANSANGNTYSFGGSAALAATLDRFSLVSIGADTFDAGEANYIAIG